ncbi:YihY/virulence factor BrkB family protein [Carboxylicivirga sp. M1479]|uniref:YihY/virulence factor BrkB family protein n=1 Tax=Carboxylicivirga sp. M1479 TaxID=2594476 RepID=UPI00117845C9|nr:YihY/virulence factor BrkB family protein [Carboxylicivirga sp. M1479]TRX70334.1 YihY/virulence factor BrkB family protein [Carboxylicivirga sp. M1479]
MTGYIAKIVHYLNDEIWRVRADQTPKQQFFLIRLIRTFYLAIKGFVEDNCPQKAASLSFYSFISIVPVAALGFGIAKGFGLDRRLSGFLESHMEGQAEVVQRVSKFASSYLESTPGGNLAGIGLAILLWSVLQVFSNIETSFNQIWKVKQSRSMLRKFSDFMSLMFVGILTIASSGGMIILITNRLSDFGVNVQWLIPVVSYFIAWIVFALMLSIMPNARVKPLSAIFGGIIAGTMFQLLQFGYFHFQKMVTSYNVIYGTFAALPLFMLWMNLSWLIVLFGAELTYAQQNAHSYEYDSDIKNISNAYKRILLLFIVERVVKRFDRGEKAYNNLELSLELKLPLRLVNELLYKLVDSDVFCEIADDKTNDTYYQPALSIQHLTIVKVNTMIDQHGTHDLHYEESEDLNRLKGVIEALNDKILNSRSNVLLKDL